MKIHLVFSSLKRWLVLWVTTDKKISAGVAACGVSVLRKRNKVLKNPKNNVFEKLPLVEGCKGELHPGGSK